MGASCKKSKVAHDACADEKPEKPYVTPEPINEIAGCDVNRGHALYQYALFCTTRLIEKYKYFMFPDVSMSLGSFREDFKDYLAVLYEVYNDLAFEERSMKDNRVDEEACSFTKDAISELAFMFLHISVVAQTEAKEDADTRQAEVEPTAKQIGTKYAERQNELQNDPDFETFYGDTLKMLVTDLERKDIWQLDTAYSNKDFQEQLKDKEPSTYQSLLEESLVIQVPCRQPGTAKDKNEQQPAHQPEKEETIMRNQGFI